MTRVSSVGGAAQGPKQGGFASTGYTGLARAERCNNPMQANKQPRSQTISSQILRCTVLYLLSKALSPEFAVKHCYLCHLVFIRFACLNLMQSVRVLTAPPGHETRVTLIGSPVCNLYILVAVFS